MLIHHVAAKFGISKRALRYYEDIGMLQSLRMEGSNYRYYDGESLKRLEQIMLLKRLGFAMREIRFVLEANDHPQILELFDRRLETLQHEINALTGRHNLIKTITAIFKAKGMENVNVYQVLREQLFIHKEVEEMTGVNEEDMDWVKIEIGAGLVPHAETLIQTVKGIRAEVERDLQQEIPLMRIRDSEALAEAQYQIMFKGVTEAGGTLNGPQQDNITLIGRDLEKILRNHWSELVSA